MKKAWDVRRYNAHPAPFSETLASAPIYYTYPFDTLPEIATHAPYHFAIADTGRKLRARYGEGLTTAELERDFPGLSSLDMMKIAYVWNIFVAWMRAVSDSAWRESSQVSAAQEVSDAGI
ncbi:hypothetical protein EV714DRAFT_283620 [Schizophyllum commune]